MNIFLQELDSMFYRFLWKNKPNKISKKCVCLPYQKGGLKMLDVNSFLSFLKISWLRRVNSQSPIFDHASLLYPDVIKIFQLGSEFLHNLMRNIHNAFWHDVFKHCKKLWENAR